jgi:hypothetical protein
MLAAEKRELKERLARVEQKMKELEERSQKGMMKSGGEG